MAVDNRNFTYIDLPDDDPEDSLFPEDDSDEEDEDEVVERRSTYTPPPPPPRAPWQTTPAFGSPTTVWPPRPATPWSNTTPPVNKQTQYHQTRDVRIDRKKKIIFCDLYDILIESESAVKEQQADYLTGSNNYKRTGITPRGLYDIRFKTEVWSKLAAFGADYIFCITNQPEKTEEDLKTWKVMTDFVMYALADYLRLPHDNCRCLTKLGFSRDSDDTKPGIGLIKRALSTIPGYSYGRKDLVVIGINSGYQNQSDVDRRMARKAKIDYIDVNDLLSTYY